MALSLLPGAAVAQLPLAPRAPLVLDVRTQEEWDAGHISCAKRMPVQDDSSLIQAVKLLVGLDLTVRQGRRHGPHAQTTPENSARRCPWSRTATAACARARPRRR